MATTQDVARRAKKASLVLGALSLVQRNDVLQRIHDVLVSKKQEVLAANKIDMDVRLRFH